MQYVGIEEEVLSDVNLIIILIESDIEGLHERCSEPDVALGSDWVAACGHLFQNGDTGTSGNIFNIFSER